jgi:hypothetical protein
VLVASMTWLAMQHNNWSLRRLWRRRGAGARGAQVTG